MLTMFEPVFFPKILLYKILSFWLFYLWIKEYAF